MSLFSTGLRPEVGVQSMDDFISKVHESVLEMADGSCLSMIQSLGFSALLPLQTIQANLQRRKGLIANTSGNIFSTTRVIFGGASDDIVSFEKRIPKVKPDLVELYIRLPLFVQFYKDLMQKEDDGVNDQDVFLVLSNDSIYKTLFDLLDVRNRSSIDRSIEMAVIEECNKIAAAMSGKSPKDIINAFIDEVNRSFGILNSKTFMDHQQLLRDKLTRTELAAAEPEPSQLSFDFSDDSLRLEGERPLSSIPLPISTPPINVDTITSTESNLFDAPKAYQIVRGFYEKVRKYASHTYDPQNDLFSERIQEIRGKVGLEPSDSGRYQVYREEVARLYSSETTEDPLILESLINELVLLPTAIAKLLLQMAYITYFGVSFSPETKKSTVIRGLDNIPSPSIERSRELAIIDQDLIKNSKLFTKNVEVPGVNVDDTALGRITADTTTAPVTKSVKMVPIIKPQIRNIPQKQIMKVPVIVDVKTLADAAATFYTYHRNRLFNDFSIKLLYQGNSYVPDSFINLWDYEKIATLPDVIIQLSFDPGFKNQSPEYINPTTTSPHYIYYDSGTFKTGDATANPGNFARTVDSTTDIYSAKLRFPLVIRTTNMTSEQIRQLFAVLITFLPKNVSVNSLSDLKNLASEYRNNINRIRAMRISLKGTKTSQNIVDAMGQYFSSPQNNNRLIIGGRIDSVGFKQYDRLELFKGQYVSELCELDRSVNVTVVNDRKLTDMADNLLESAYSLLQSIASGKRDRNPTIFIKAEKQIRKGRRMSQTIVTKSSEGHLNLNEMLTNMDDSLYNKSFGTIVSVPQENPLFRYFQMTGPTEDASVSSPAFIGSRAVTIPYVSPYCAAHAGTITMINHFIFSMFNMFREGKQLPFQLISAFAFLAEIPPEMRIDDSEHAGRNITHQGVVAESLIALFRIIRDRTEPFTKVSSFQSNNDELFRTTLSHNFDQIKTRLGMFERELELANSIVTMSRSKATSSQGSRIADFRANQIYFAKELIQRFKGAFDGFGMQNQPPRISLDCPPSILCKSLFLEDYASPEIAAAMSSMTTKLALVRRSMADLKAEFNNFYEMFCLFFRLPKSGVVNLRTVISNSLVEDANFQFANKTNNYGKLQNMAFSTSRMSTLISDIQNICTEAIDSIMACVGVEQGHKSPLRFASSIQLNVVYTQVCRLAELINEQRPYLKSSNPHDLGITRMSLHNLVEQHMITAQPSKQNVIASRADLGLIVNNHTKIIPYLYGSLSLSFMNIICAISQLLFDYPIIPRLDDVVCEQLSDYHKFTNSPSGTYADANTAYYYRMLVSFESIQKLEILNAYSRRMSSSNFSFKSQLRSTFTTSDEISDDFFIPCNSIEYPEFASGELSIANLNSAYTFTPSGAVLNVPKYIFKYPSETILRPNYYPPGFETDSPIRYDETAFKYHETMTKNYTFNELTSRFAKFLQEFIAPTPGKTTQVSDTTAFKRLLIELNELIDKTGSNYQTNYIPFALYTLSKGIREIQNTSSGFVSPATFIGGDEDVNTSSEIIINPQNFTFSSPVFIPITETIGGTAQYKHLFNFFKIAGIQKMIGGDGKLDEFMNNFEAFTDKCADNLNQILFPQQPLTVEVDTSEMLLTRGVLKGTIVEASKTLDRFINPAYVVPEYYSSSTSLADKVGLDLAQNAMLDDICAPLELFKTYLNQEIELTIKYPALASPDIKNLPFEDLTSVMFRSKTNANQSSTIGITTIDPIFSLLCGYQRPVFNRACLSGTPHPISDLPLSIGPLTTDLISFSKPYLLNGYLNPLSLCVDKISTNDFVQYSQTRRHVLMQKLPIRLYYPYECTDTSIKSLSSHISSATPDIVKKALEKANTIGQVTNAVGIDRRKALKKFYHYLGDLENGNALIDLNSSALEFLICFLQYVPSSNLFEQSNLTLPLNLGVSRHSIGGQQVNQTLKDNFTANNRFVATRLNNLIRESEGFGKGLDDYIKLRTNQPTFFDYVIDLLDNMISVFEVDNINVNDIHPSTLEGVAPPPLEVSDISVLDNCIEISSILVSSLKIFNIVTDYVLYQVRTVRNPAWKTKLMTMLEPTRNDAVQVNILDLFDHWDVPYENLSVCPRPVPLGNEYPHGCPIRKNLEENNHLTSVCRAIDFSYVFNSESIAIINKRNMLIDKLKGLSVRAADKMTVIPVSNIVSNTLYKISQINKVNQGSTYDIINSITTVPRLSEYKVLDANQENLVPNTVNPIVATHDDIVIYQAVMRSMRNIDPTKSGLYGQYSGIELSLFEHLPGIETPFSSLHAVNIRRFTNNANTSRLAGGVPYNRLQYGIFQDALIYEIDDVDIFPIIHISNGVQVVRAARGNQGGDTFGILDANFNDYPIAHEVCRALQSYYSADLKDCSTGGGAPGSGYITDHNSGIPFSHNSIYPAAHSALIPNFNEIDSDIVFKMFIMYISRLDTDLYSNARAASLSIIDVNFINNVIVPILNPSGTITHIANTSFTLALGGPAAFSNLNNIRWPINSDNSARNITNQFSCNLTEVYEFALRNTGGGLMNLNYLNSYGLFTSSLCGGGTIISKFNPKYDIDYNMLPDDAIIKARHLTKRNSIGCYHILQNLNTYIYAFYGGKSNISETGIPIDIALTALKVPTYTTKLCFKINRLINEFYSKKDMDTVASLEYLKKVLIESSPQQNLLSLYSHSLLPEQTRYTTVLLSNKTSNYVAGSDFRDGQDVLLEAYDNDAQRIKIPTELLTLEKKQINDLPLQGDISYDDILNITSASMIRPSAQRITNVNNNPQYIDENNFANQFAGNIHVGQPIQQHEYDLANVAVAVKDTMFIQDVHKLTHVTCGYQTLGFYVVPYVSADHRLVNFDIKVTSPSSNIKLPNEQFIDPTTYSAFLPLVAMFAENSALKRKHLLKSVDIIYSLSVLENLSVLLKSFNEANTLNGKVDKSNHEAVVMQNFVVNVESTVFKNHAPLDINKKLMEMLEVIDKLVEHQPTTAGNVYLVQTQGELFKFDTVLANPTNRCTSRAYELALLIMYETMNLIKYLTEQGNLKMSDLHKKTTKNDLSLYAIKPNVLFGTIDKVSRINARNEIGEYSSMSTSTSSLANFINKEDNKPTEFKQGRDKLLTRSLSTGFSQKFKYPEHTMQECSTVKELEDMQTLMLSSNPNNPKILSKLMTLTRKAIDLSNESTKFKNETTKADLINSLEKKNAELLLNKLPNMKPSYVVIPPNNFTDESYEIDSNLGNLTKLFNGSLLWIKSLVHFVSSTANKMSKVINKIAQLQSSIQLYADMSVPRQNLTVVNQLEHAPRFIAELPFDETDGNTDIFYARRKENLGTFMHQTYINDRYFDVHQHNELEFGAEPLNRNTQFEQTTNAAAYSNAILQDMQNYIASKASDKRFNFIDYTNPILTCDLSTHQIEELFKSIDVINKSSFNVTAAYSEDTFGDQAVDFELSRTNICLDRFAPIAHSPIVLDRFENAYPVKRTSCLDPLTVLFGTSGSNKRPTNIKKSSSDISGCQLSIQSPIKVNISDLEKAYRSIDHDFESIVDRIPLKLNSDREVLLFNNGQSINPITVPQTSETYTFTGVTDMTCKIKNIDFSQRRIIAKLDFTQLSSIVMFPNGPTLPMATFDAMIRPKTLELEIIKQLFLNSSPSLIGIKQKDLTMDKSVVSCKGMLVSPLKCRQSEYPSYLDVNPIDTVQSDVPFILPQINNENYQLLSLKTTGELINNYATTLDYSNAKGSADILKLNNRVRNEMTIDTVCIRMTNVSESPMISRNITVKGDNPLSEYFGFNRYLNGRANYQAGTRKSFLAATRLAGNAQLVIEPFLTSIRNQVTGGNQGIVDLTTRFSVKECLTHITSPFLLHRINKISPRINFTNFSQRKLTINDKTTIREAKITPKNITNLLRYMELIGNGNIRDNVIEFLTPGPKNYGIITDRLARAQNIDTVFSYPLVFTNLFNSLVPLINSQTLFPTLISMYGSLDNASLGAFYGAVPRGLTDTTSLRGASSMTCYKVSEVMQYINSGTALPNTNPNIVARPMNRAGQANSNIDAVSYIGNRRAANNVPANPHEYSLDDQTDLMLAKVWAEYFVKMPNSTNVHNEFPRVYTITKNTIEEIITKARIIDGKVIQKIKYADEICIDDAETLFDLIIAIFSYSNVQVSYPVQIFKVLNNPATYKGEENRVDGNAFDQNIGLQLLKTVRSKNLAIAQMFNFIKVIPELAYISDGLYLGLLGEQNLSKSLNRFSSAAFDKLFGSKYTKLIKLFKSNQVTDYIDYALSNSEFYIAANFNGADIVAGPANRITFREIETAVLDYHEGNQIAAGHNVLFDNPKRILHPLPELGSIIASLAILELLSINQSKPTDNWFKLSVDYSSNNILNVRGNQFNNCRLADIIAAQNSFKVVPFGESFDFTATNLIEFYVSSTYFDTLETLIEHHLGETLMFGNRMNPTLPADKVNTVANAIGNFVRGEQVAQMSDEQLAKQLAKNSAVFGNLISTLLPINHDAFSLTQINELIKSIAESNDLGILKLDKSNYDQKVSTKTTQAYLIGSSVPKLITTDKQVVKHSWTAVKHLLPMILRLQITGPDDLAQVNKLWTELSAESDVSDIVTGYDAVTIVPNIITKSYLPYSGVTSYGMDPTYYIPSFLQELTDRISLTDEITNSIKAMAKSLIPTSYNIDPKHYFDQVNEHINKLIDVSEIEKRFDEMYKDVSYVSIENLCSRMLEMFSSAKEEFNNDLDIAGSLVAKFMFNQPYGNVSAFQTFTGGDPAGHYNPLDRLIGLYYMEGLNRAPPITRAIPFARTVLRMLDGAIEHLETSKLVINLSNTIANMVSIPKTEAFLLIDYIVSQFDVPINGSVLIHKSLDFIAGKLEELGDSHRSSLEKITMLAHYAGSNKRKIDMRDLKADPTKDLELLPVNDITKRSFAALLKQIKDLRALLGPITKPGKSSLAIRTILAPNQGDLEEYLTSNREHLWLTDMFSKYIMQGLTTDMTWIDSKIKSFKGALSITEAHKVLASSFVGLRALFKCTMVASRSVKRFGLSKKMAVKEFNVLSEPLSKLKNAITISRILPFRVFLSATGINRANAKELLKVNDPITQNIYSFNRLPININMIANDVPFSPTMLASMYFEQMVNDQRAAGTYDEVVRILEDDETAVISSMDSRNMRIIQIMDALLRPSSVAGMTPLQIYQDFEVDNTLVSNNSANALIRMLQNYDLENTALNELNPIEGPAVYADFMNKIIKAILIREAFIAREDNSVVLSKVIDDQRNFTF